MTGTGSEQRGVEGDQVKLVTDLSSFSTGHSRREKRDRRFFLPLLFTKGSHPIKKSAYVWIFTKRP